MGRRRPNISSASASAAPPAAPSASQRAISERRARRGRRCASLRAPSAGSRNPVRPAACCTRLPWMKSMPLIHSVAAACGSSTCGPITCRPSRCARSIAPRSSSRSARIGMRMRIARRQPHVAQRQLRSSASASAPCSYWLRQNCTPTGISCSQNWRRVTECTSASSRRRSMTSDGPSMPRAGDHLRQPVGMPVARQRARRLRHEQAHRPCSARGAAASRRAPAPAPSGRCPASARRFPRPARSPRRCAACRRRRACRSSAWYCASSPPATATIGW